ncbi:hypothetical protein ML462_10255 [Gramella lutea]|uniref:Uncharacterized protein n=1 Tax=Christiangramia lutea TaxID=1607951 RepID=A0A9X1V4I1_9FLAO|nr:hypothetical protein [Christiangramia lutea]MCH4823551.1 hypothetical protein [Christiangramia lutea]
MKNLMLLLLPCIILLSSEIVQSQETAYDLRDLIGARGSSSEIAIEDRGYDLIKVDKSSGQIYQYWWNTGKTVVLLLELPMEE